MSECTLLIISPMKEDPLLLVGVGGLENLMIRSLIAELPRGVRASLGVRAPDMGEDDLLGDVDGDRAPPSPAIPRKRADALTPCMEAAEDVEELEECLRRRGTANGTAA